MGMHEIAIGQLGPMRLETLVGTAPPKPLEEIGAFCRPRAGSVLAEGDLFPSPAIDSTLLDEASRRLSPF